VYLLDATLMAAAGEGRRQPHRQNLVGEAERDDAAAHREHVGVVVLARQASGEQIVAERGAHAAHLVGGNLLALAAAAEHDAAIGAAFHDCPADIEANRRVIDRLGAVGATIVNAVSEPRQGQLEVLLQRKARMIGADRDAHAIHCSVAFGLWALGLGPRAKSREPRAAMFPTVVINARGEERLRSGHPWIYRADVADVCAQAGDAVLVRGPRGRELGHGLYSDRSQIALRMMTYGTAGGPFDPIALIRRRLESAVAFRESLAIDATAYRLVHGEADLLPSLIVDRYGEYLVVQALSQGMDRRLPAIVSVLTDLVAPRGILARNDPRVRTLEGLEQKIDVLAGDVPETVTVREIGLEYEVDLRRGQKTGLFLDQRENRAAAALYARGRLLDCFSYNGGFALALGRRCQETIAIDISADAVARVRQNALRNGVAVEARVGNVFDELRGLERLGERFDTIVLDPPAFAKNKAAIAGARGGYKEINLRALKLLNAGGTLVTCSCSYHVGEADFAEIVYEAAIDAQTHVTVVEKRMQGRDHPVMLGVPETYYLKCFILRKPA
jgi:23S rRNA (cytosine1962-C5)-methyltransferase